MSAERYRVGKWGSIALGREGRCEDFGFYSECSESPWRASKRGVTCSDSG